MVVVLEVPSVASVVVVAPVVLVAPAPVEPPRSSGASGSILKGTVSPPAASFDPPALPITPATAITSAINTSTTVAATLDLLSRGFPSLEPLSLRS